MSDSKQRVYLLLVGIFLLLIFVLWFLLLTNDREPDTVAQDTPVAGQSDNGRQAIIPYERNTIDSPQLYINTKFGDPIAVRNFLKQPQVESYDDDTFLLAEETGQSGTLYQIFFHRGGGIGISLNDTSLEFSRSRAEAELESLLDVSVLKLCAMEISVTVPAFVSQQLAVDYSGIDFGMSRCPASISFADV